jgi:hypothetical protein
MIVLKACWRSSKAVPMAIIGGLDVHRSQITYDWVDPDSGQRQHGRLAPATRQHLRVWLGQFAGRQATFALEGCTGWRDVVEELQRAGIAAHLAEPADTSALRGPKRRAKTDQTDARHLRELLEAGRLPESWIPPTHVLEVRTQVRCYKALADEHTAWLQRIHATVFHHGVPAERNLLAPQRRGRLERGAGLSPAAHQQVTVALRMLDHLDAELDRLRAELVGVAVARWAVRRWTRCTASVPSPPWRSGPSWAMCAALPLRGMRSATAAWTSPGPHPTASAPPGTWPARVRPCCAGRWLRRPSAPPAPPPPTTPTTSRSSSDWAATAPPWRWLASWPPLLPHLGALGERAYVPPPGAAPLGRVA